MMKLTTDILAAAIVCTAIFVSGCGDNFDGEKTFASQNFDVRHTLKIGVKTFTARIALTDFEKARGLMGEKNLPENETMLFVYDTPQRAAFWMKDTLIPLDIGFFTSDGVLTEVKKLYPQNLNTVYSSRDDILFCIESNAGWFEKNGIKSPQKLDAKLLERALKLRGK